MRISFFSLFRDSSKYINNCLSTLDQINSKHGDFEFNFFFYENDSIDNTKEVLSKWFDGKSGKLLCENIQAPKYESNLNKNRMLHMSNIRNKMLSLDEYKDSDYSVIFDSDVNFNNNIIRDFLKYKDLNFSMLTPNIRQDVPCKMGSGQATSYYDSSILFDLSGTPCMTWSNNPFYEDADRDNFKKQKPIQVKSAFGSFAFIKTEYLKYCNWQSKGESEHLSFCRQLTMIAPIYLIPSIQPSVHIATKNWDHEDQVIARQKHLLKNKWNRFLWKTQIS